ncbi:hypothetical protein DER46DRAFT_534420 [Fusarium sp. MPI-SDFR-AT-0072]|nr:hypothetical protein DER46DRAFT_534420 [Fusarium sp. MPI-SDFR-AT-0072]
MIPLVIESWIWYAITWLVVIVRLLSRRMVVGSFKKYQIEDYLMILAMVCDAVLIACINVSFETGTNLIDPTQRITLTPDEISRRRFGSQLTVVAETLQCTVIWLVKCCLLLIYNRLATNLSYNRVVKTVAVYVLVGFVVMMTLYLAVWCRPFSEYWTVPTEHDPYGPNWTFWYIRESSTSLIVANLPLTWPLFRRIMHINTSSASDSNPQLGPRESYLFRNVLPSQALSSLIVKLSSAGSIGFPQRPISIVRLKCGLRIQRRGNTIQQVKDVA